MRALAASRVAPTTAARASAPAALAAPARALAAGDAAWLAVLPTVAVLVLAIALLGPPLGDALAGLEHVRFWGAFGFEVRPEPAEQGRFLLALAAPLLLAGFTVAGVRWRGPAAPLGDALVTAVQAALVTFVVVCLLAQDEALGPLYPLDETPGMLLDFASATTLLAAAAGTLALVAAARSARARGAFARWTRESRGRASVAGLLALGVVAVWLLHAVFTEGTVAAAPREVAIHVPFTLDETYAVLDGRSPLVDFAAQYGSLWPYALAAAMSLLGTSIGVWIALAVVLTGVGMLALYATLRRVAGSSVRGLLLFLPVLAVSCFTLERTAAERYTYATYYGTFPLRYVGPCLLAWLLARHLDGAWPRRAWPLLLAAGLVALNNADAGVPALAATVAALLWAAGRPTRDGLRRLVLEAAAGLAAALALVSLLTLVRAGALPDLGLLLRYTRLFGSGFGLYPMPTLGLHLVVYATFVAALGLATVRALRDEPDRLLTGLLAWSGVFGLGVGAYFAGRSVPTNLVATFLPWSFALALLLGPALRSIGAASWRRPPLAATACVFAFLAMACSLAQTPTPWEQLERLGRSAAAPFAQPLGQRFVAAHTRPGESAAILLLFGHRIGASLDVTNVLPYSNSLSMPSVEQLEETIAALRAAGGRKLFARPGHTSGEMQQALVEAGFTTVAAERGGKTALWLDRRAGAG